MKRLIMLIFLYACLAISACSIRLSKPDASGYAEVTSAVRPNGHPAILIKKVETHGIQERDLNADNNPKVVTVYLRAGSYLAELGCQGQHTYMVSQQPRTDIDYSADTAEHMWFEFSVEANKKYILDCNNSVQNTQFMLIEVSP